MKASERRISLLLLCLVFAALKSCDTQQTKRVLFIGNSYTFFNGGLDKHLRGLAPSTETESIALGGYSLERHWNDPNTLRKIRETKWDYVVLQEQSQTPIINRKQFFDFARKFDEEIRGDGAKTILLMTWERPDSKEIGVTTDSLAATYTDLGKQLGATVAPAGIAFARALRQRPGLVLNNPDGHPTMEGTYLAACVLYQTIFGQSPVGNPYSQTSISEDTRTYLQQIAAGNSGL
jgi:hypothetical protein